MKITLETKGADGLSSKMHAVFVFEGERPAVFPELLRFIKKEAFEGKSGQTFLLHTLGKEKFSKLILIGLGKKADFRLEEIRRGTGAAVRIASTAKTDEFSIAVPVVKGFDVSDIAATIAETTILATYKVEKYKGKKSEEEKKKEVKLQEVRLIFANTVEAEKAEKAVRKAEIVALAQNYTREIAEQPANFTTPAKMADVARKLAKEKGLKIEIFNRNVLAKKGMNGILAVGAGSVNPPVMVVLEYNAGKNLPLYAIVGKGIVFDAGGISIKPSKGMHEMKYDKSGASIVLGVLKAVAELKLPIRLMGLMPLAENMPSGSAQKPGDIITLYNGKTAEVLNTDAEGRLILADALAYAAEKKPKAIIDLATLTGAIIICLGREAAGLFSNDDALAKTIEKAGEKTFERVWRLPLWKEYGEMIKSDIADIKNIGSESGEAGSITAAKFLEEFVGETKWAHLDIAGVDNVSTTHPYLSKGATGTGVRLVVETLSHLARE